MPASGFTSRLVQGFRAGGVRWLASAVFYRLVPARLAMKPAVLAAARECCGLEIGGPSRLFAARLLPIYPIASRVDNVNFSAQTTWEADLRDGGEFAFDRRRAPGRQFIRDATALTGIPNEAYDFVLSSHCLEHVANPLLALREWRRVTRPNGYLILILPNPARTFDHRRPITTLDHLRNDCVRATGEDDTTHVNEVLALHDLARDPWAGSPEAFRARVRRNAENRCLHHHVFDLALATAALRETGWEVLAAEIVRPIHLVTFAKTSNATT